MSLKTLETSLDLLQHFTEAKPAWGVRDLAKEVKLSHSVVHRILSTFEQNGFLIQDEETKKYELGVKFWEYGQLVQERIRLTDLIHPVMEALSEQVGESIFLTVLQGLEGVCIDVAESPQAIKYAVSSGSRTQLYAGASNKVMMAFLPCETQSEIMERGLMPITKKAIDKKQLSDELEEIRKKGWSFSVGEYTDEVFGIAVPLFNYKGEIFGSLTMAGPEYRLDNKQIIHLVSILKNESVVIQNYLAKLRIQRF